MFEKVGMLDKELIDNVGGWEGEVIVGGDGFFIICVLDLEL